MTPANQHGYAFKAYLLTTVSALIAAFVVLLILKEIKNFNNHPDPPRSSSTSPSPPPTTSSAPPLSTSQQPSENAPPTDAEIISLIDEYSHPDDPTKPADLLGSSDDVIKSLDSTDAADLLKLSIDVARKKPKESRFKFNLGRIAYFHGYKTIGMQLLHEAADAGSAPALAYLGMIALEVENDTAKAIDYFKKSIKAGFKSLDIQTQLTELTTPKKSENPVSETPSDLTVDLSDYRQFAGFEIIQKIISKNYSGLNNDPSMEWFTLVYVQSLHHTLWSGGDILFMAHPKIMIELDPRVELHASYRLNTSDSIVAQKFQNSLAATFSAAGKIIGGAAYALQNAKNPQDIINLLPGIAASANQDLITIRNQWLIYKLQGEYDARRLAIGFSNEIPGNLQNREQFRKIYKAIKDYVLSK